MKVSNPQDKLRFVLLMTALLSCMNWLQAQTASHSDSEPSQKMPRLSTRPSYDTLESHRRITIDVLATDALGRPVAGLIQSDFTVFDNKVEQKILSFQSYDQAKPASVSPAKLVLILDAVNMSYQDMIFERQDLEKFLNRNNGKLDQPTSLALVTDTQLKIQPQPTLDGKKIIRMLKENQNPLPVLRRASGGVGEGELLGICLGRLRALAEMEYNKPGRKIFIWIGRGWPSLNVGSQNLTDQMHQDAFDAVIQLQTRLRESRVTLYTVNPNEYSEYKSFLKPVTKAQSAEWPDVMTQVVSVHTGGRVIDSGNDIAYGITECLKDMTAWYTLSFDSPPSQRIDEFHKIDVRTDRPELRIRTSYGYYNQP